MRCNLQIAAVIAFLGLSLSGCGETKKNLDSGNFFITSDCVTPSLSGSVQVFGNRVTSGDHYLSFGFPTEIVRLGEDNIGVTRICKNTYGDSNGGEDFIFSCFDRTTNTYVCTIHIQAK
jgi:hypothetical protein